MSKGNVYRYDHVKGEVVTREELARREAKRTKPRVTPSFLKDAKVERGRWIYDRAKGELVAAHEYRRTVNAPYVMGDIDPYKSMHDGSVIGGRRQHREHLRANGLIEYGNDFPEPMKPKPLPPAGPDIKDAIDIVRAGHRPGRLGTFNPGEFE